MKNFLLFITRLLVLCVLLGGAYVAYDAHHFLTTPASSTSEEIIISIAPGATFDRVAWDLKKAGAITDVTRFRLLAQFKESLGKVKAGEFHISTGWTPEQVLAQITGGKAVLYRLSLREGLTWWDTAKAVEEQGFATFEDFKAVIHDPEFLKEFNIPFANAEGFLFPETYLMNKPRSPLDREQAREVAATMVRMFWKKTEPLWKDMPKKGQGSTQGAMQSPPPASPAQPAQAQQTGQTQQAGQASQPEQAQQSAQAGQSEKAEAAAPPAPDAAAPPSTDSSTAASTGSSATSSSAASSSAQAVSGASAKTDLPEAATPQDTSGQDVSGQDTSGVSAEPAPVAEKNGPQSPADVDPDALRHLVILASLVEKETGVPSERGLVAGVYANRLRIGMLLQCDPTIIYGIGESFKGAIRRSQLDDPKNLYNTYQHPGLPPGPICSSGIEALKAAANPTAHDYLFFVATGLGGGHTFSKTLAQHNKAVQVYRARMRGQK